MYGFTLSHVQSSSYYYRVLHDNSNIISKYYRAVLWTLGSVRLSANDLTSAPLSSARENMEDDIWVWLSPLAHLSHPSNINRMDALRVATVFLAPISQPGYLHAPFTRVHPYSPRRLVLFYSFRQGAPLWRNHHRSSHSVSQSRAGKKLMVVEFGLAIDYGGQRGQELKLDG